MKYLKLVIFLFAVSLGAQNYQYSIDQRSTILQEEEGDPPENTNAIVIPQDFDWNNIPTDYDNAVWIIKYDFDLKDRRVSLPENVTLNFEGGILRKATLEGDGTLVTSNGNYQVFETIALDGTFKNEYLKPCWFGAVMDGITDDRAYFVETLAQAQNIGAKVLIDGDIFLDVEETGEKSIFLEDDTWIEGKAGRIILNNQFSPAFWAPLSKNINIKDIEIIWDQSYDAKNMDPQGVVDETVKSVKEFLESKRNIEFVSHNPKTRGGVSYRAIFLLGGSQNVTFDNVKFKAKGETANRFIPMGIKLLEQYSANQTVSSSAGETAIPHNITLKNVVFDGTLMAIQGIVDGFNSKGLRSYRYSDAQTESGSHVGAYDGSGYNFPPPHLMYLNSDSSDKHHSQNIEIVDTIDYGQYVGTSSPRPTSSGYCVSLTVTGTHKNVLVDNYESYRRDGFLGVQDMTNGIFKNIYTEYNSSIFEGIADDFNNIRFVGKLNEVKFENIIIKDNADISLYYPLDGTNGDNVTIENVHVYVKELSYEGSGPFSVNGSNNTVINSSLNIEKHSANKTHIGVIALNNETMNESGNNNYYDLTVNGWRNIESNPEGKSIRLLFQSSSNSGQNYAKVNDVDNKFLIEQINHIKRDTWSRNEVITLGSGDSQSLNLNIPRGFAVSKITANTTQNLANEINVSIGTSSDQRGNLLSAISNTLGEVSNTIKELDVVSSDQSILLYSDGSFQNKGEVEITIELIRIN